jgi:parvulin-like peptidyl-prolyl isomerase
MGIISIRRMARKLLAPVVLLLILGMLIGVFYIGIPSWGREAYGYKGPSLKIYGKKIKDSDFNNYIMRAAQQAEQYAQFKTYSEAEIRDSAVNYAVQAVAFDRELKNAGSKIKVSNAELDKALKKYFPTEEELNTFMLQQGFTKSELRKTLAKELEYQKFVQNKARELEITIPEEELLGYLDEISVRHILVSVKSGAGGEGLSDSEALARANEVHQKLTNNGDFVKLAKEYSDDPGSKNSGGLIGPMPVEQFKNSMVKEFADASLALKPGEISKPVKSQYGYHVIKLESKGVPTGDEYNEKRSEIENQLLFQKANYDPKYTKWLEDTFKKAEDNMDILDPGLRAYRLMKDEKWQEASDAYQKALKRKYYKNRPDIYVDASTVYLKLNQASKAVEMLNGAPNDVKLDLEFQIALAKAYHEDEQPEKAKELLLEYGEGNLDNSMVHQRLKAVFSDWEMQDAVEKEEKILADIQKMEAEALQKYQQELEERSKDQ